TESLRVIAHPIRLSIINYIGKEKEINVNSIYNTLKLEQSITSQHLKLLRETGIVKTERKGKFIIYSLNYKKIKRIVDGVNKFLGTRK
ncbi:MAG: metalloregulator ArsR/SmtB family transcription factor, partial [Flavobacteriaceae bacterium]|nr:metalloregulator ArsR/SmtB family transcription factor [Flavobacteriaceae bacterium]